jgi:ABC-type dipeptide/oligopeptide/nickel transport system permease component
LVLPSVALGFSSFGQLLRLVRASVLEVRGADFVRTAKAKGLMPWLIAARHVLPNVLIPLLSVAGIQFTYLLGGSVYIETIFAWPGLGSLLSSAIQDSDFPLVQAITILISVFAIGVQLLTDVFYALADPRVQHG